MLELYLLRHADAGDSKAWTGDDAARPLSPDGHDEAARLGAFLAHLDWRPDAILTSPKVRAAETARILGGAVGVAAQTDDRLAQSFGLTELAQLLASRAAGRIILVGHDPDFSDLTSALVGGRIDLRKCALARIDLEDGAPKRGNGRLRWLLPPDVIGR